MKSIELLATGIRLVGIYLLVLGARTAAYQYEFIQQFFTSSQYDPTMYVYSGIAEVVLIFLSSYLLMKFPVSISKCLLPKTKEGEVLLDGSVQDIQTSLFCVLGVYILSWSIPDLVNNTMLWWYVAHSQHWVGGSESKILVDVFVTLVEIGIGLYLSLQASGVSNLILRLRTAGTR